MIAPILTAAMPILFAFGTLRVPVILEGVLEHRLGGIELRPATARGFRTVYYPGRTYPALIEAPGAVAEGTAVSGLSAADLALLDVFEGAEYERRAIEITIAGHPVAAEYYWSTATIAPDAPAWSFAEWQRQHGEALIVAEGDNAATLRRQLIDQGSNDR